MIDKKKFPQYFLLLLLSIISPFCDGFPVCSPTPYMLEGDQPDICHSITAHGWPLDEGFGETTEVGGKAGEQDEGKGLCSVPLEVDGYSVDKMDSYPMGETSGVHGYPIGETSEVDGYPASEVDGYHVGKTSEYGYPVGETSEMDISVTSETLGWNPMTIERERRQTEEETEIEKLPAGEAMMKSYNGKQCCFYCFKMYVYIYIFFFCKYMHM